MLIQFFTNALPNGICSPISFIAPNENPAPSNKLVFFLLKITSISQFLHSSHIPPSLNKFLHLRINLNYNLFKLKSLFYIHLQLSHIYIITTLAIFNKNGPATSIARPPLLKITSSSFHLFFISFCCCGWPFP